MATTEEKVDVLFIRQDAIEKEMKDMKAVMEKFDDKHREHEAGYAMLLKAFPGGDVDGHRRYHELTIAKTEEIRRLRVAIQEKTISGLIWAGIMGLGAMVWKGFLEIVGK